MRAKKTEGLASSVFLCDGCFSHFRACMRSRPQIQSAPRPMWPMRAWNMSVFPLPRRWPKATWSLRSRLARSPRSDVVIHQVDGRENRVVERAVL